MPAHAVPQSAFRLPSPLIDTLSMSRFANCSNAPLPSLSAALRCRRKELYLTFVVCTIEIVPPLRPFRARQLHQDAHLNRR
jgi:hypothetical protein